MIGWVGKPLFWTAHFSSKFHVHILFKTFVTKADITTQYIENTQPASNVCVLSGGPVFVEYVVFLILHGQLYRLYGIDGSGNNGIGGGVNNGANQ